MWAQLGEGPGQGEGEKSGGGGGGRGEKGQMEIASPRGSRKRVRTQAESRSVCLEGGGVGVAGLLKRQNSHYTDDLNFVCGAYVVERTDSCRLF